MKWKGRRLSTNIEDRRVNAAADTLVAEILGFLDKAIGQASDKLGKIIQARTPPTKTPRRTIAGGG